MPLYLLPNVFNDEQKSHLLLPEGLSQVLESLDGLIAESERTGRRYLIKLLQGSPFARELPIFLLNEHSSRKDQEEIVKKITSEMTLGLITDAGMPGIADPGADLVHLARRSGEKRIFVIPGPSSLFLALVSSGLPGQNFSFRGYLPKEKEERINAIKRFEYESKRDNATQIFIETPYRNDALLADLLEVLSPRTELAVASQMTFADESVEVYTVGEWRKHQKIIGKVPTVFLFCAR
jgi:16S rRNA (cytidine1402-2'-O)-methyltransferase